MPQTLSWTGGNFSTLVLFCLIGALLDLHWPGEQCSWEETKYAKLVAGNHAPQPNMHNASFKGVIKARIIVGSCWYVRTCFHTVKVELKYGLIRNILAQLSLFGLEDWTFGQLFYPLPGGAEQCSDLCVSPKSPDWPAKGSLECPVWGYICVQV